MSHISVMEHGIRLKDNYVEGLTFCNESMSSANGLSARYFTLFHVNVRRYWSAGSISVSAGANQIGLPKRDHTVINCLLLGNLRLVTFQDIP
jgi:hypothetical protein